MPIIGTGHSDRVNVEAPYFSSLQDLDKWATRPRTPLSGLIPYHIRSQPLDASVEQHGKLLVCHDYKGGYTESPSALSYTFNFWNYCDTFIYFAHHRITIPPPGWVNAAHRHGSKILGVLIFEGGAEPDCLRLLVGNLAASTRTGPAAPSSTPGETLPLSPHYARLLAELAYQRGFDGYLLNFECPLMGKVEQTRALTAWNTLLQAELQKKIGPHAQTIWYDSVIIDGQLRWQDRLNAANLPFFLSSTSFFTNYTWPCQFPSMNVSYFHSLPPASTSSHPILAPKTLRDIFVGVDVWGRGQHGGGGLGCFRALDHISPNSLGLSVALFGHAWTWESEQDKPGWDWQQWWGYERTFWIGSEVQGTIVQVPPMPPRRQGEAECTHEDFAPISDFFKVTAAPDPKQIPFLATLSPGVGTSWFVEGKKVFQSQHGWTDVDKQTSLGDLLWPRPHLIWESEDVEGRADPLPVARAEVDMDDAWNGGSSVRVWLSGDGSQDEDAVFRCVQLPIQSLAVSYGYKYRAEIVYKSGVDQGVDFDIGFSVKLHDDASSGVEVTPGAFETDLQGGWARQTLTFIINAPNTTVTHTVAHIGLIIGFATEDPTAAYKCSVSIGQLSVYPAPSASPPVPKILWADFQRDSRSPGSSASPSPLAGVLTWDTAISLPRLTSIRLTSPDDPIPAWSTAEFTPFPTFAYFNVYIELASTSISPGVRSYAGPQTAQFIGTTGLTGARNELFIDKQMVPQDLLASLTASKEARFYVQGVTDQGKVLEWAQCAFVVLSL